MTSTPNPFDHKIYERDIYQDTNQDTIYDSWLKHANERDVLETVLEQRLEEWCQTSPLSLLELGCGTGSAARRIFNLLKKHHISYNYTGIDPYQDQLARFHSFVDEHLVDKQPQITLQQGSIETYTPQTKYDLALAVHSLYYVNDLTSSLQKIHTFANHALIVHHGKQGINTIQHRFHNYVKPGPNIISTHQDITKTLDQLDIDYTYHVYPTTVDIRPCKDPHNPHGRNMIKFFLEQAELLESIFAQVSSYFQTQPDVMQHDMAVIITEQKTKEQKALENYFI